MIWALLGAAVAIGTVITHAVIDHMLEVRYERELRR